MEQLSSERQQEHLNGVSRTFALTIPMLGGALQDYVSNAYLLCRIADTIEDDPCTPKEDKIAWLNSFAGLARAEFKPKALIFALRQRALDLCNPGAVPAEYALLEEMPQVIARTLSYPLAVRKILGRGVELMAQGMARELQGQVIKSEDDVDLYCYYVAGVVGELLCELFVSDLDGDESGLTVSGEHLRALAVSFGEGLQLTNIIKDRFKDQERGASFLPACADEQAQVRAYAAKAQGHLADAIEFICAFPQAERRVRAFCLMNTLMAVLTLKKINQLTAQDKAELKISRGAVKKLYLLVQSISGSRMLIKLGYRILSLGVKRRPIAVLALYRKVSRWQA